MTAKMFNLEDLFADPKKEQEGVWVDFFGGSRLKIGSSENPVYKNALARLGKKHRLRLDSADPQFADTIRGLTCEAMAEGLLLDWENIAFGPEGAVPYSKEKAKEALQRSSKLRNFVEEQANELSNFKADLIEETKKS